MGHEALLLVESGGQRYAVAQRSVAGLQRLASNAQAATLGALLGTAAAATNEPYALSVATDDPLSMPLLRIDRADLSRELARLDLPEWLARLAHPAVVGLALDGTTLVPLIDLVQLVHHTGTST